MDRSWMYDRTCPGRKYLKRPFVKGVDQFVKHAMRQDIVLIEGGIRCPCDNCRCQSVKTAEEVIHDLYMYGFQPNYWIWTNHGEVIPTVNLQHVEDSGTGASSSGPTDMGFQNYEQFDVMQGMISDALGVKVSFEQQQYDDTEELPNEAAQRFYNLLMEANKPLYEGSEHSTLSMCVRLLGLKGTFNVPELCMDYMTKMMLDATPFNTGLPQNYYDAKRLVSKLGLGVQRIDCCVQGCMLYYDNEFGTNDGALTACKFCQEPRYRRRNTGTSRNKPVPRKAMFYLPIVTRLQRMFASMQTASKMTWHYDNRRNSGELRHPSDGEAWKHFDRVHPDFAADPRNVRLGLCSDGFSPYVQTSTKSYSCWPVIVTPYNLPPDMCMSKPYMFLSCVIPGPTSPTAGIDIYLEPLIDDLKRLWTGVLTYDIARKQNFMMRAALMWTINDFPTYGMLSGWGTHGKLACPICMEDTKAFTLHYGGKTSWFDSHRRFLPSDHPFRKNKNAFVKGVVETEDPPRRLTSQQVWRRVKDLPKVQPINGHIERPDGYGEWHNWTKRSIFWDLEYWKDNLLRHNLDVMHIEKNIFDNIFNIVMNVKGKTKDNEKARRDLAIHCRRPDLLLVDDEATGKTLKPVANYTLSPEDAKSIYQWITELKMPDGYSSNLSRCANVNNGNMQGMKSHDCHVFMECLLPIAFSNLPPHVLIPLTEMSQFFKNLCSAKLRKVDLVKMDQDIPLILCKLEKIFPPGFFDSMEHLPVHLAKEAILGGPVQYRWMYPFERFMGDSKRSVKNKAKVEGSICYSYLHRETTFFCSYYFNKSMLSPRIRRNEVVADYERHPLALSVFCLPGRHAGGESTYWLTDEELTSAHVHVLINCTEVKPYLEAFLSSGQIGQDQSSAHIHANFPEWFRQQVYLQPPTPINRQLRNLSDRPRTCVKEWHTYFVNGYKFHTQSWTGDKQTINSGVYIKGDSGGGEDDFYGVITLIYELAYTTLDYNATVVVFYCVWFDPSDRGTKKNPKSNTVDIKMSRRYPMFDPFVMAQHARQVYYVPYPSTRTDKRDWCVAIKTKPRSRIESDDAAEEVPYQTDEMSNINDVIEVERFSRLCDQLPNTGEEVDGDDSVDAVESEAESEADFDEQWDE